MMNKKYWTNSIIGSILLLNLTACEATKHESSLASPEISAPAPASDSEKVKTSKSVTSPSMIAYKHFYQLALPESLLAKYWSDDQKRCQLPQCEIVYADFKDSKVDSRNGHYSKAILKVKINADLYPKFSEQLVKRQDVQISYCKTESENKQQEIIDTESRLKSLNILKNKLLYLIENHGKTSNIGDILKVEAELSKVQQEIEQLTSQRLGIQDSINRVTAEIEYYSVEEKSGSNYYLEPITQAFAKGLYDFSEGLGSAISFIFIALPWLILVIPFLWFSMKLLNTAKAKISDWKLFKSKDNNLK